MPHHLAELNMRLFAEKVMPVLRRDTAFQGVIDPVAEKPGQARIAFIVPA